MRIVAIHETALCFIKYMHVARWFREDHLYTYTCKNIYINNSPSEAALSGAIPQSPDVSSIYKALLLLCVCMYIYIYIYIYTHKTVRRPDKLNEFITPTWTVYFTPLQWNQCPHFINCTSYLKTNPSVSWNVTTSSRCSVCSVAPCIDAQKNEAQVNK